MKYTHLKNKTLIFNLLWNNAPKPAGGRYYLAGLRHALMLGVLFLPLVLLVQPFAENFCSIASESSELVA